MAIHNWIRCHWRNGRHVLHDVPDAWCDEIDTHILKHRSRARDLGKVRTATLESVCIAWVECDVPLGSPDGALTYRQARAVHALVRPLTDEAAWTREEAESLLTDHYGEAPDKGLTAQHQELSRLSYPDDAERTAGLFVGAEAPLPTEMESAGEARATAPSLGYAQRHLVDAWEEWVAEGGRRRAPLPARHSTPETSQVADETDPLATTRPLWRPTIATLHERVAAVDASAEVAGEGPSVAADDREHLGPRASMGQAEPIEQNASAGDAPPADTTSGQGSEPQLFDLSTPRRERSDAPASSLAGLLGPSYTTTPSPGS